MALLIAAGLPGEALTEAKLWQGYLETIEHRGNQYLDNHRLQALGALIALWTLRQRPAKVLAGVEADLRIDMLSFTAPCVRKRSLRRLAERHGKLVVRRDASGAEKKTRYKMNFDVQGIEVSFKPRDKGWPRYVRFEFTPSKVSLPLVAEFVSLSKHSESVVTRVDVAVDLPCSLQAIQLIPSSKIKVHSYVAGDGVETIQFGKGSKLRAYDAARRHELPPPVTRFEQEVRKPKLSLLGLPMLTNMFAKYELMPLTSLHVPLPQRLQMRHVQLHGPGELRSALGDAEFDALCVALRDSTAVALPHPAKVFEQRYREEARELLRKIGVR